MSVNLSVAISADGYIDDNTPQRLVLSSAEDWAEVYSLRAKSDVILIGGETLRRDNPRLLLKSKSDIDNRLKCGKSAHPTRVVVSGKGAVSPDLRLFDGEGSDVIIFSNIPRPELDRVAEIIVCKDITASFIVTQLEKRSLHEIFVEGGSKILDMFLREGVVDRLRVAQNPDIKVDDPSAPSFSLPEWIEPCDSENYNLGGVEVTNYEINKAQKSIDIQYMERTIEASRRCIPSPTSYCVGAVVVTKSGEVFEGYTHETSPTHHAEQAAIFKAEQANADLRGATMYSSMEPCSTRASEPESCSAIMIRLGFRRSVFALYEPSCFVVCEGALNMRRAGIKVECYPQFGAAVREINAHVIDKEK